MRSTEALTARPARIYRCALDGARFPVVVMHLLPGDVLTVESPGRSREFEADPDFPWVAFHCDDPCPRIARYPSELRLAQNTPLARRRTVTLALRAIRRGGAAVLEYGEVQAYRDRTIRGAIEFSLVEPRDPAAEQPTG